MTLAQFKHIYFWEFAHRLLGRLIGLVFAAAAMVRGPPGDPARLWLEDGRPARPRRAPGRARLVHGRCPASSQRTDVSHFRLSAHLLLALTIMAALIWVALDLRRFAATGEDRPSRLTAPVAGDPRHPVRPAALRRVGGGARRRAGRADWPTDAGPLLPRRHRLGHGVAWALTNDPYLVHFVHRWWAWVVVAAMVVFARQVRKVPGARPASVAIHAAFGTQIVLGILTVLSGVVIWLAALHQAVGALLLAATIWGAHAVGRR